MAVARAHQRQVREERDAPASHKSAGARLTRYHYEKTL
jgi:hypothetical protein